MNNETLKHYPLIERITRRDGLPTHQIHRVCFAFRRFWFATPNGLTVYDGETVKVYQKSDGLLTHGLRSIVATTSHLWVCSDRGVNGFSYFPFQSVKQLDTAQLGYGWCQSVVSLSEGSMLLATAKGLLKWSTVSDDIEFVEKSLMDEHILALESIGHDSVLIHAEKAGIWYLLNGDLRPFVSRQASSEGECRRIGQYENGYWILFDRTLLLVDKQFQTQQRIALASLVHSPKTVLVVSQNTIYVADSHGVFQLTFTDADGWQSELILPNVVINDFSIDEFQNVVCASDHSGLYVLSALNSDISRLAMDSGNSILSLRMNRESNRVLVGGALKSFVVDSNDYSRIEPIQALDNCATWDLQSDRLNNYWAATAAGLALIESADTQSLSFYFQKETGATRSLLLREDFVLIGAVTGLYRTSQSRESLTPIYDVNNDTLGYVYHIKEHSNGKIYILTLGRGLWIYDLRDNHCTHVYLPHDYSNIYDLVENDKGLIAIAADQHVLIGNDAHWEVIYQSALPVCAWSCRWLDDEHIALGSSEGLKVLNINQKGITFQVDDFPMDHYWEFTTSRSLLSVGEQTIWCGTNEALNIIDYERFIYRVAKPTPEIVGIKCSMPFEQNDYMLSITQGDWSLSIELSCFWRWCKSPIRYEYRLLGLDERWYSQSGNIIHLTTLPVGEYFLEVKVDNLLTRSDTIYPLIRIKVVGKNMVYRMLDDIFRWSNNVVSRFHAGGKVIQMKKDYQALEEVVSNRTKELTHANKELSQLNEKLERLSSRDQLTGIHNRRIFLETLEEEIKRHMRSRQWISILMFDIDYFKKYNDHYGHLAGDQCLQQVAVGLATCFHRSGDMIARYGGEEFVGLLTNTDLQHARTVANNCVESIRKLSIPHLDSETSNIVTVSIGIYSAIPEFDHDRKDWQDFSNQLIDKADAALYRAKENGRNQFMD